MKHDVGYHLDWERSKRLMAFAALSVMIFLILWSAYRPVLVPVFLGFFFAYILRPVVDTLERRYQFNRTLLSGFIVIAFMAALVTLLAVVIPVLIRETIAMWALIPRTWDSLVQIWLPRLQEAMLRMNLDPRKLDLTFKNLNFIGQVSSAVGNAASRLVNATPTMLFFLVSLVLLPMLTFFMLADKIGFRERMKRFIPDDLRPTLGLFVARLDRTIRVLLRGQVIVAGVHAALYSLGFSLAGLEYSLAVGAVTGVCRLVPYGDIIVGAALSAIVMVSHFEGWPQLFYVVGVFVAMQGLDAVLITPRVIGERIGLHPLLVIVSVMAFGNQFGFLGVLLAVPALAIMRVVWELVLAIYRSSPLMRSVPKVNH